MFRCEYYNFSTEDESRFNRHILTKRHIYCAKRDENIKTAKLACDTCYRRFHSKKTLTKHKEECKQEQHPLECKYCKKVLSSSSNKSRHHKTYNMNNHNGDQTNHISGSHNTVNQTVNQNNNYIIINEFGKEDMSYVSDEEHDKFIKNCINKNLQGILDYIADRHFNKHHP